MASPRSQSARPRRDSLRRVCGHRTCRRALPPPPDRTVEPLLREIDAQHPFYSDRRAAMAGLWIERLDQPVQRRPRHDALHLGQKRCPSRRLGVAVKPHRRQRQLLNLPQPLRTNRPRCALYHDHWPDGFCRGPLSLRHSTRWFRRNLWRDPEQTPTAAPPPYLIALSIRLEIVRRNASGRANIVVPRSPASSEASSQTASTE